MKRISKEIRFKSLKNYSYINMELLLKDEEEQIAVMVKIENDEDGLIRICDSPIKDSGYLDALLRTGAQMKGEAHIVISKFPLTVTRVLIYLTDGIVRFEGRESSEELRDYIDTLDFMGALTKVLIENMLRDRSMLWDGSMVRADRMWSEILIERFGIDTLVSMFKDDLIIDSGNNKIKVMDLVSNYKVNGVTRSLANIALEAVRPRIPEGFIPDGVEISYDTINSRHGILIYRDLNWRYVIAIRIAKIRDEVVDEELKDKQQRYVKDLTGKYLFLDLWDPDFSVLQENTPSYYRLV